MTRSAAELGSEPAQAATSPEGPRRLPFPVVLSAPSGSGKTSVTRALLERVRDLSFAVSCTTRPRRDGEVAGRDYEFVSREEFRARIEANEFVEWAMVHGHCYGTPRAAVEAPLAAGRHVLLDVDVQGGKSLLAEYSSAVSVFLLPPSISVMRERLRGRGTEGDETLRGRLAGAVREIRQAGLYQYVLVNDRLEETVQQLEHILRAEEQRRSRIVNWRSWIEAAFGVAARGEEFV